MLAPVATTLFDFRVRLLECAGCGAPIEAAVEGGMARCGYCGATNQIGRRRRDTVARAAPSMADEIARRSRLQGQLHSPVHGHAYDMSRPPIGFEGLLGSPEALRHAYASAKAAGAPVSTTDQHRLAWLALRMADAYGAGGQRREQRAILETTLDVLPDAGHRHLLRCRLAVEALRDGDPNSAAGWLAECDARQEVLQLDSCFRAAQARLHATRGELPAMLELLGSAEGDVPIHPELIDEVFVLRLHALDGLGQGARADALLGDLRDFSRQRAIPALARREGLAVGVVLRCLTRDLSRIPGTWVRASIAPLALWPVLAVVLFVPVTIARCANVDPLMGLHGNTLCPRFCEGCHGPLRTYTEWSCSGGECSTNGPQYFCPSPENGIAEMDEFTLGTRLRSLARWEMSYAPGAATLLVLMALSFPFVVFLILRMRWIGGKKRAAIEKEIEALTAHFRVRAPPPYRSNALVAFLVVITMDVGGAMLLVGAILLELR